MEGCCRLCAGIADPSVCLTNQSNQKLADWIANNLNVVCNDVRRPSKVCLPCVDNIKKWIIFCDKYKKSQAKFKTVLDERKLMQDTVMTVRSPPCQPIPDTTVKILRVNVERLKLTPDMLRYLQAMKRATSAEEQEQ